MPVHLIVVSGADLIADLPAYDGPIPRVGEYIAHPPLNADYFVDYYSRHANVAGCVKQVIHGLYARPRKIDTKHFVATNHPWVEVHI